MKDLELLPVSDPRGDWKRWRFAGVASVAVHVVALIGLSTVEPDPYSQAPERIFVHHITPLYTPPDLTQKAPNKGPVKKELTLESIAPRPVLKTPAPSAAASAKKEMPTPPPQVALTAPKTMIIEPPRAEAPVANPQLAQALIPQPVQPPPPGNGAPKLVFEEVNKPQRDSGDRKPAGALAMPSVSVQDAVRSLTARSGIGPGQSVGDSGDSGSGPGLNLPPSAGRPRSNLELKSDPMGVDFHPYMLQVLAAVRRNWFAVYPEAARLGQRGEVVLQFAIAKQGLVQKVVFNGQSGAKALDQSAVAAISASNPLPPLPAEFKGDRIVLQMTFLYNMPR